MIQADLFPYLIDQDFIKYLENLEVISVYKILFIFLILLFFCIYFVNNLSNNRK